MATQLFTGPSGRMQKRDLFPSEKMSGIPTLIPEKEASGCNFLGFGVAITASSCYLLAEMKKEERKALLRDREKRIALLVNPRAEKVQAQIDLDGTLWYVELLPDTVSTIQF